MEMRLLPTEANETFSPNGLQKNGPGMEPVSEI